MEAINMKDSPESRVFWENPRRKKIPGGRESLMLIEDARRAREGKEDRK
jgi:hypothetical protein